MEFADYSSTADWQAGSSPGISSLHEQLEQINDYRLGKHRHPLAGCDQSAEPFAEPFDSRRLKSSLRKLVESQSTTLVEPQSTTPIEPQSTTPLEPPKTTTPLRNLVEDNPTSQPAVNRIDPAAYQADDHDSDLRFWTNELAGGTAAGLSGGPLAQLLSAGAKRHLARAIEADDMDNPIARSVADDPHLLKVSQWWEEHFGVADGGKLLDRIAQRQADLNAELVAHKADAMAELDGKLRETGPPVAKSLQRLMNDVLTPAERRMLAGYWQLSGKTPGHLNLVDIGIVPEGLDHMLKNPAYAKSCQENGIRLLDKLADNVSPGALKQFQQYHNLVTQVVTTKEGSAAPELEQYIKSQQELIYRILKIAETYNFKASVADLQPEGMGKILRNSVQSCEASPTGFWRNFGRGMIFAGAVQFGEDLIERGLSLGESGHGNPLGSYARAIGIPLALSSQMNPAAKFGVAVGIGVLGSCADALLPQTKDIKYSSLLTPSPMEQAIVGLAAGLPIRSSGIAARVFLIGGALAASKVIASLEEVSWPRNFGPDPKCS